MTDLIEPDVTGPDGAEPDREERGRRVELTSAACFVAATLASIALAVVYWQGGQPQAEGVLLAVSLGGIGTGIVLWAKHFMPSDEVAEDRHPLQSSEEEIAEFSADFEAGQSTPSPSGPWQLEQPVRYSSRPSASWPSSPSWSGEAATASGVASAVTSRGAATSNRWSRPVIAAGRWS